MSNINILVVIVSCIKNKHLWDQIKNRTNNKLIIITGSDKYENYYDREYKVLHLKCSDLYDGLPEKIICMIDQVLNIDDFKDITHIIKIDDHDTYFTDENIKNLVNYKELELFDYLGQRLNTIDEGYVSDYHNGKVHPQSYWYNRKLPMEPLQYFDGGCTYILSRKAMEVINKKYNLSNMNEVRENNLYEDYMIAKILNENNIKPHKIDYGIRGDK